MSQVITDNRIVAAITELAHQFNAQVNRAPLGYNVELQTGQRLHVSITDITNNTPTNEQNNNRS